MFNIPELYFKMIYNIIKQQNQSLLHDISVHENISLRELNAKYLPKLNDFKKYMTTHHD